MEISERIQELSSKLNVSISALATKTNINRATLYTYINGSADRKPARIPADIVADILKTFPKVSAEWLLLGNGEMIKSEASQPIAPKIEPEPYSNYKDKYIEAMEETVKYVKLLSDARKEIAEARMELIDCLKGHLENPLAGPSETKLKR